MQQPVLRTSRLVLRALTPVDEAVIFQLRTDNRVNTYLDRSVQTSLEEAAAFIKKVSEGTAGGKSYYWGITIAETDKLIGTICIWNMSEDRLHAEIGYELLPEEQGKGIMREALKAVIDFAFTGVGLQSLEAWTHRDNKASTNLLIHHGFMLQTDRKDPDNDQHLIYCLKADNA